MHTLLFLLQFSYYYKHYRLHWIRRYCKSNFLKCDIGMIYHDSSFSYILDWKEQTCWLLNQPITENRVDNYRSPLLIRRMNSLVLFFADTIADKPWANRLFLEVTWVAADMDAGRLPDDVEVGICELEVRYTWLFSERTRDEFCAVQELFREYSLSVLCEGRFGVLPFGSTLLILKLPSFFCGIFE